MAFSESSWAASAAAVVSPGFACAVDLAAVSCASLAFFSASVNWVAAFCGLRLRLGEGTGVLRPGHRAVRQRHGILVARAGAAGNGKAAENSGRERQPTGGAKNLTNTIRHFTFPQWPAKVIHLIDSDPIAYWLLFDLA
ncbi:hypothetical protein ACHMW9_16775 [Mesorhizobium terrae]